MTKMLLATPLLLAACAGQTPPPPPSHVYGCEGGITTVHASYPNAQTAIITLQTEDSRPTYTLHQGRTTNGVKYSTSRSANPTTGHFIWWTKGSKGLLFTTALSTTRPAYVYEKQLAACTLNASPTANTAIR